MRCAPNPLRAILLSAALLPATAPTEARPAPRRPHHPGASDMDATLARMAARDRLLGWGNRRQSRPLALPPATRERVAAPPFTGWGYGGTIPQAGPGF